MVCRPLKGAHAFDYVMRSGRRVTSGPLLLAALPGQTSDQQTLLGVGVPKRVARKAVTRNRIKRLLRAAFQSSLAGGLTQLDGVKMVCLWRNAPEHPALVTLPDVERHVRLGIQKLLVKGLG